MPDDLLREVRMTADLVAEALGTLVIAIEEDDLPSEDGLDSVRRILIGWHDVRALSVQAERS